MSDVIWGDLDVGWGDPTVDWAGNASDVIFGPIVVNFEAFTATANITGFPPSGAFTVSAASGNEPLTVTFTLTDVADGGSPVSSWYIDPAGDGSLGIVGLNTEPVTGATRTFTYNEGSWTPTLHFFSGPDFTGENWTVDSESITVSNPLAGPSGSLTVVPSSGAVSLQVAVTVASFDPGDTTIASWELTYGNGSSDSGTGEPDSTDPGTTAVTYTISGNYVVRLTVVDENNVSYIIDSVTVRAGQVIVTGPFVEGDGMDGHVVRWTFKDGMVGGLPDFTFPVNPNSSTLLGKSRKVTTKNLTDPTSRALMFQGAETIREFEFGGILRDQTSVAFFALWAQIHRPIKLSDDLGRTYTFYITSYRPKRERAKRTQDGWRMNYTISGFILDQDIPIPITVPPDPNPDPEPDPDTLTFTGGMQVRYLNHTTRDIDKILLSGCEWVRSTIDIGAAGGSGSAGNPLSGFDYTFGDNRDKLEYAKSIGLKVLATMTYSPSWMVSSGVQNGHEIPLTSTNQDIWVSMGQAAVDNLGEIVDAYEIWNEPNHHPFNRNPEMATLRPFMRKALIGLRNAYPDAEYMVGGPASASSRVGQWDSKWDAGTQPKDNSISPATFLDRIYESGGIVSGNNFGDPYQDAMPIHGYTGNLQPDYNIFENPLYHAFRNMPGVGSPAIFGNGGFNYYDHILQTREPGTTKVIWQTEGGLYGGHPTLSEGTAGNYMIILLAWWRQWQYLNAAGPYFNFELFDHKLTYIGGFKETNGTEDYLGMYTKKVVQSATAGGVTSTTLSAGAAVWTANQWQGNPATDTRYFLEITSGDSAQKQRREIISNTTSVLTLERAWDSPQPSSNSTYVIGRYEPKLQLNSWRAFTGAPTPANEMHSQALDFEASNFEYPSPPQDADAIGGWVAGANTTIDSSNLHHHGTGSRSLRLSAQAAGNIAANSAPGASTVPASAGFTYTATYWVLAETNFRSATPYLLWKNAAGDTISAVSGPALTDNATTWIQLTATGVAPAGTTGVQFRVRFTGCAINEYHFIDEVRLSAND